MNRFCFGMCFGLALVWNLGCNPAPNGAAPAANVTGTITLDGKLIPTGEIHFGMPGVPPSALTITDGTFSGPAPIGKCQVEVFIYVEGPPSEKPGGTRSKKNTAPAKYWGTNTILDATVTAGGPNEFKFELSSR